MTLTDALEAYVCLILTAEFYYDYWYNTRENRIKRRKVNAKKAKDLESPQVSNSSGKKDLAMEPGTPGDTITNAPIKRYI